MTEMREWWANVYDDGLNGFPDGVAYVFSRRYDTRYEADEMAGGLRTGRVHVRLKPEGAPKRYASGGNRRRWERAPETCRGLVALGHDPAGIWADTP